MHNNGYKTEYEIENKFIEIIQRNWYHYLNISNYDELLNNFRNKLNIINQDELNNQPLTDDEFEEIKIYLENKNSIFSASQILRSGKIDIIKRNNRTIYLKIIDLKNIENNKFEVAHQINTNNCHNEVGRFDVTLLINGLPIVQIELKKPGIEINQAFNQIIRYKKNGYYRGIFNFIQLFVISNEQHTKYFCNNDNLILKSNCFTWADKDNKQINLLYDFEENFLFCPFIFKMVFHYMIDSAEQRKLFVMRPYQIYALEALKKRCIQEQKNGYCFHSTGSGKTLTSFKFAYEMSKNNDIDKVFFLVDRKDLDDKTVDDFNSYMSSSKNEFTSINKTTTLIKDINSTKKLIISTINKMSISLKDKNRENLKKWFNKKIIFIFDECHRSQAGEMRKLINQNFSNALFYGFTGTPIFNEQDEINEKSKLTYNYFGFPIHVYNLKDAIGDKNVLPFCIEYYSNFKEKSVIKDQLVLDIDRQEILLNDQRCQNNVNCVLENFNDKTVERRYNAIFACQSIKLLVKYYHLFQKSPLIKNFPNFKIAAIYSKEEKNDYDGDLNTFEANNELNQIIEDYNRNNSTNHTIQNYDAYERNVINNFRNKNIDILLVVDKCLTGMDFVKCNTLYLDKKMKMHGLIQAMSRTNRLSDETKNCGNIICFQTLKKDVEQALAHFNNDQDVYKEVTLRPFDELYDELNKKFNNCEINIKLANSKSEKEQKIFILLFRDLMLTYKQIKNYTEFNENNFNLKRYLEMQSLYKDLYNQQLKFKSKESVINDIDFEIQLLDRQQINFDYITELLNKYQKKDMNKNEIKIKLERIVCNIPQSKKKLIIKFVNQFMSQKNDGTYRDPVVEYQHFVSDAKEQRIKEIAQQFNLNPQKIKEIIDDYSFYQDEVGLNNSITSLLKPYEIEFKQRIKILNSLPILIKQYFEQFNDITLY